MAEAEEVISSAARYATVFARDLWQRHRALPEQPVGTALRDVSARIDLLITAIFGTRYPIRPAQPPARPTLLSIVLKRSRQRRLREAIPATNGVSLWLPPDSGMSDRSLAMERYRVVALQQATRAHRGSAVLTGDHLHPLVADVYLLLEAYAADEQLIALLPGLAGPVNNLRRQALQLRPPLSAFPESRQPLEWFVRTLLSNECGQPPAGVPIADSPAQSLRNASFLITDLKLAAVDTHWSAGAKPLLKDWWTGELLPPPPVSERPPATAGPDAPDAKDASTPRSARLARRPEVRAAKPDEDDDRENPGAWMVQTDEPHPHAEDPLGLQRPTDRDEETAAEEFSDLLSELPEARLVSTPARPKEVLIADDLPDIAAGHKFHKALSEDAGIRYPEWDYRLQSYREPGATVRLLHAQPGSQRWVDDTLAAHRSMLDLIRRRFEMLRARRVWQRKQPDGDAIDVAAYVDSYADFRAGSHMSDALYQTCRRADRDMAITLLIDISGSTDSWVAANRRIIDVEREALLLVSSALEGMCEPYSIQAFSGEGPQAVTVRQIKRFDEHYGNDIALRISSLEPEHYTRAGAAIRHTSALLMHQPAAHRLLLLLSDGKPNDIDDYEGRYGVEDMRQAVIEARLQGIFPFCLTIDRQAADYLPRIFGTNQYALLSKPERLPLVLLDWMKRLVFA
jgi:nitric oxide reductase NorD protein